MLGKLTFIHNFERAVSYACKAVESIIGRVGDSHAIPLMVLSVKLMLSVSRTKRPGTVMVSVLLVCWRWLVVSVAVSYASQTVFGW